MSASILGDHIERVVRPVWASEARKDRMREELAAHLMASFEEERAHLGDDRAAAERAIRRLGEAGELTRNLRGSVPWPERILFMPLHSQGFLGGWEGAFPRRADETLLHFAVRITAWMTGMIAGADLVGVLASLPVQHRPTDWPVVLVWAAATLVVIAAGTFFSILLCEAMARALQSGSARRTALHAALSSLMVMALISAFVRIVAIGAPHGQVFRQSDWLGPLVLALVAPMIVILGARDTISRRRRRAGWGLPEITT